MKKELFQNKYRIGSTRLPGYDYGNDGLYFITICTKNRAHRFGHIQNGIICLSPEGQICYREIIKTNIVRKDVTIDDFIVMPNHVHMIVCIKRDDNIKTNDGLNDVHDRSGVDWCDTPGVDWGGACNAPLHNPSLPIQRNTSTHNHFGPQIDNLASIVRGIKGSITSKIKSFNTDFARQPRFYDHIIRDDVSHYRIQQYIIKNPADWTEDTLYGQ